MRSSEKERGAERQPERAAEEGDDRAFAGDRDDHEERDDRGVFDDRRRVDEHADGHEEEDREQVTEGDDLGRRLVRLVRLGNDDPGDEGAESQRQAEDRARDKRRQQCRRDDRQQEQLARSQLGYAPEQPGQEPSPDHVGENQEHDRLADGESERAEGLTPGERRQGDDEHDRRQVLDDRPTDGGAAVKAVHLAAIHQRLDDDEGRRDRQAGADDQRLLEFEANADGDRGTRAEDDDDLEDAAGQRQAPDIAQLADRELDTEREQQHDDADVGEDRDLLDVADEARGERPDHYAGEEIANDRRLTEADRDDPADQGGPDCHRPGRG